jgi:hypothetical protein
MGQSRRYAVYSQDQQANSQNREAPVSLKIRDTDRQLYKHKTRIVKG